MTAFRLHGQYRQSQKRGYKIDCSHRCTSNASQASTPPRTGAPWEARPRERLPRDFKERLQSQLHLQGLQCPKEHKGRCAMGSQATAKALLPTYPSLSPEVPRITVQDDSVLSRLLAPNLVPAENAASIRAVSKKLLCTGTEVATPSVLYVTVNVDSL